MNVVIPYISDEQASAATRNPHMKLLFRLVQFSILDEGTPSLLYALTLLIVKM